jgi:hypothetical protein
VTFPRAFPRGPWSVRVTLSDGTVRHESDGTILFPRLARAASPARAPGSSGSNLPIYLAGAVLGVLALAASTLAVLRRGVRRGRL